MSSRSHLRARDIPALPLLFLLHLIFTISSLFLRIYEVLTNAETDLDHDALTSTITSPTRKNESQPPKHVGMVLLTPSKSARIAWSAKDRARTVECVMNLVGLAAEEGVSELSLYESNGLLEDVKDEIMAELLHLPLSPPTSEPQMSSGRDTPIGELHEVDDDPSKILPKSAPEQVTTFTIFSDRSYDSSPLESNPQRLIMHLLPPSTSDVVATVTNNLRRASIHSRDVELNTLDESIRAALHFSRDPDILIVHSLFEPTGWKSWLPRPAPELGGYPFWTLRISEIYHHSPPLPLLSFLKPLLHLARTSNLPFLRKMGRLVPPPPHIRNEMLDLYDGPGRMEREEWEGAMRAWRAVEQRLGR